MSMLSEGLASEDGLMEKYISILFINLKVLYKCLKIRCKRVND